MTVRRSVLVTGAGGQVGHEVLPAFDRAGWLVHAFDRASLDVTRARDVGVAFEAVRPDVVVNLAAWTAVDDAEVSPAAAMAVNAEGAGAVVGAAAAVGARVCHVSTEHVFDGTKATAYDEDDPRSPRSAYGRSKAAGEAELRPGDLCVRTSWVSGAFGTNAVKTVLALAADPVRALAFVDDQRGCPTTAADLAGAIERLVADEVEGTVHVTNARAVSWFELAQEILAFAGLDAERVQPIATHELVPPRAAPRPANGELAPRALERLGLPLLRDHSDAIAELVGQLQAT